MQRHTEKEDSHVKMKAEPGAMLPQAKGHLRLSVAGRGKEGSSP